MNRRQTNTRHEVPEKLLQDVFRRREKIRANVWMITKRRRKSHFLHQRQHGRVERRVVEEGVADAGNNLDGSGWEGCIRVLENEAMESWMG